MNVRRYMPRTISWKRRTGENSWNEGTYAAPVGIPARVEESVRIVEGSAGNELRATNEVMVTDDVRVGDLVDWRGDGDYEEVEARNSESDLAGEVSYYVLYFEPVSRS